MSVTLGVLVPPHLDQPGKPAERPLGRAAAILEAEGVAVILGWRTDHGVLHGVRARDDRWVETSAQVHAILDRFPSQQRHVAWLEALCGLPGVPWSNPPALVALCRDKVACQRVLERRGLPVPPIEARPEHMSKTLKRWGTCFVKPRFGALGYGVQLLCAGDTTPSSVPAWPGGPSQPTLIQQAITPPKGWAGIAIRANAQREKDGSWTVLPVVVRRSRDAQVVNAARGAEVVAAQDVMPELIPTLEHLTRRTVHAISDHPKSGALIELGIDFVLDEHHHPWVLEVNTRPIGRLRELYRLDPDRWSAAHLEAYTRPLRTLASTIRVS